jgi:hypothetical protein
MISRLTLEPELLPQPEEAAMRTLGVEALFAQARTSLKVTATTNKDRVQASGHVSSVTQRTGSSVAWRHVFASSLLPTV